MCWSWPSPLEYWWLRLPLPASFRRAAQPPSTPYGPCALNELHLRKEFRSRRVSTTWSEDHAKVGKISGMWRPDNSFYVKLCFGGGLSLDLRRIAARRSGFSAG